MSALQDVIQGRAMWEHPVIVVLDSNGTHHGRKLRAASHCTNILLSTEWLNGLTIVMFASAPPRWDTLNSIRLAIITGPLPQLMGILRLIGLKIYASTSRTTHREPIGSATLALR